MIVDLKAKDVTDSAQIGAIWMFASQGPTQSVRGHSFSTITSSGERGAGTEAMTEATRDHT